MFFIIMICQIQFISAEKIFLKNNWFFSLTNEKNSWKPIDLYKSLEDQGIFMKKNEFLYYRIELNHEELKDLVNTYNSIGIYLGKIDGQANIYFNGINIRNYKYNNRYVYFRIDGKKIVNHNTLLIKIKKMLTAYPCKINIMPYIDGYYNVSNDIYIIVFFQIIAAVCILIFGISFGFYFSHKLKNTAFIVFFILSVFSFVNFMARQPYNFFFTDNFFIDYLINKKIEFFCLYMQPILGLYFLYYIFGSKTLLVRILCIINTVPILVLLGVVLIFNVDVMYSSIIYLKIYLAMVCTTYFFMIIKNLIDNFQVVFILIGMLLLLIFSLTDIERIIQFFFLGIKFSANSFFFLLQFNPVHGNILNLLSFTFVLGIYLSRQFIRSNLNLMELNLSLEKKVADRTERIEDMARQKNDFFANISHELRTPLTLILGPLEALMSGKYGSSIEARDERLIIMKHNGRKLMKLVSDMLDFTKIDSGKLRIKKSRTNISRFLKFFVSSVKSCAENLELRIAYNDNIEGDLVAYTDPDLLDKAVSNLVSNSLKFTQKGGQVIVQLDKMEGNFVISVKDDGIGIPEDKLEYIFERFGQIDSSSSRRYEGTGIGLSLTKELVESLGGKMSVKSKPGAGSVFIITLPCEKIAEEDCTDSTEHAVDTKTFHIMGKYHTGMPESGFRKKKDGDKRQSVLIVEDSLDMQKYLSSILEEDYELIYARNGAEGLKKTVDARPDLVLSDVMMPELDGYRMTELIKDNSDLRHIPIILLTAKADMSMKMEGFNKGADDYIVKPFDSKELYARVKVHAGLKKMHDDLRSKTDELKKALDEKLKARMRLEESETRFREMAETLPVAIIEIDNEKKIRYYNRYAGGMLDIREGDGILDFIDMAEKENFIFCINSIYNGDNGEIKLIGMKDRSGKKIKAVIKPNAINDGVHVCGIRLTLFEFEPNVNIMLMPGNEFYDRYGISEREKDVLLLLVKGLSYKEIGEKLFISYKTVDNHISRIYQKTSAAGRQNLMKLIKQKLPG